MHALRLLDYHDLPKHYVEGVKSLYSLRHMSTITTFSLISGDYGTILYSEGTSWKRQDTGMSNWLSGVWGFHEKYLFIVGALGKIVHYN